MKANRLLELCEQDKNSITTEDGKIPHYHPEIFDEEGTLIELGPANKGPKHKHGVVISKQGDIDIRPAGDTDPDDPTHDHEPSDEAKKSTKDAFLNDFDKDAE